MKNYILVRTFSKKMKKFAYDLQVVENDKEKLEKRLIELITKMIMNGDKKEIIAYSDFELHKYAEMEEDYKNFEIVEEKLFDYNELIKKTKLKILENFENLQKKDEELNENKENNEND